MPGIGLCGPGRVRPPSLPGPQPDLLIAHVTVDVEQCLGARILRPDPIGAAEVGDAGIGRDASASEHHHPFAAIPEIDELFDARHAARLASANAEQPWRGVQHPWRCDLRYVCVMAPPETQHG